MPIRMIATDRTADGEEDNFAPCVYLACFIDDPYCYPHPIATCEKLATAKIVAFDYLNRREYGAVAYKDADDLFRAMTWREDGWYDAKGDVCILVMREGRNAAGRFFATLHDADLGKS